MGYVRVYIPPEFSTLSRDSGVKGINSGGTTGGAYTIYWTSNGFTNSEKYGLEGFFIPLDNGAITDYISKLNPKGLARLVLAVPDECVKM